MQSAQCDSVASRSRAVFEGEGRRCLHPVQSSSGKRGGCSERAQIGVYDDGVW